MQAAAAALPGEVPGMNGDARLGVAGGIPREEAAEANGDVNMEVEQTADVDMEVEGKQQLYCFQFKTRCMLVYTVGGCKLVFLVSAQS